MLRIGAYRSTSSEGERSAVGAHAFEPPATASLVQQTHVAISRLKSEPTLNDFLVTPVRLKSVCAMLRIGNFVRRYPKDGAPVTESTVAYLGYTHEYLFVALFAKIKGRILFGEHAGARFAGRRRFCPGDARLLQRSAAGILVSNNALGIQADGLYSEQSGPDHPSTRCGTPGVTYASGYVVLLRIPFTSLYFAKAGAGENRTWEIILQRTSLTPTSRLFGRRAGIASQGPDRTLPRTASAISSTARNLQFEPYALGRNLRQLETVDPPDPYFQDKHLQGYTGLDASFILHNSLVLETTINPDSVRSA